MFRTLGRSVWTPLLKCLQVGKNPGGVGKTPDQLGKTPGGWEKTRLAHFWNLFKKSGVQAQTPDHNCTVGPWPCPGPPDCICYKGVKGLFRSVGTHQIWRLRLQPPRVPTVLVVQILTSKLKAALAAFRCFPYGLVQNGIDFEGCARSLSKCQLGFGSKTP